MSLDATDLAQRLARNAEAVCRHYLSNGHREGGYWLVGDARNLPGRSLYVRLKGPETGKGAAGKWTDAATGEHGDLLDIISEARGLTTFKDVADEARAFLSLPAPMPQPSPRRIAARRTVTPPEASQRLFSISQPIAGTLAETYLRARAITMLPGAGTSRFHPTCYYRPYDDAPTETWPAMIAAVTDLADVITGAHRTWLDPHGFHPQRLGKAPIDRPKRAMGDLLGHAVRFGMAGDVMATGEGIETTLSLKCAFADMPMAAALSAAHLAAFLFPASLRRLYIARDRDPAGDHAVATLAERAAEAGIDAVVLSPMLEDFNEDLRTLGLQAVRDTVRPLLTAADAARFIAAVP
jgi:hypothetical protein